MSAIFSVENIDNHYVVKIFGIKFKFKNITKELLDNLKQELLQELKQHISNEVFCANYIYDLHSKTFPQFKNCNEEKEVVIVATGPSMKYYTPIENAIHIGVNQAFRREDIPLDYIFAIDFAGVNFYEDLLKLKNTKIFLGSQTMQHGKYEFLKQCTIPMHYKEHENVYQYCSDYPRHLAYPELSCFGLMDYTSTVFEAMHFAFYTHPKKIYLVGADCSNSGYFDGSPQSTGSAHMLEGWKKIKEFQQQYYPDVEIVSINPVGLKGMFQDIYTTDVKVL